MKKFVHISLLLLASYTSSAELTEQQVNKICSCIEKVENSKKYYFGIKSVPIKGNNEQERYEYARRICINTIKNNYRRYQQSNKVEHCYLDYLANRYCPNSCDKIGNKNWINNIHKMMKEIK